MKRPALDAFLRRGDGSRRDALWAAACWEARGDPPALERAREVAAAAIVCGWPACDHAGSSCLLWHVERERNARLLEPGPLPRLSDREYHDWCGTAWSPPGWGERPRQAAWA